MYSAEETKEMRSNIALELARFKARLQMAKGHTPYLDENDLNELFIVAGLPVLTPNELEVPDINVIRFKEEGHDE